MPNEKSPLEDLYTDSGAFDVQRVVEVLRPLLSIKRGGDAIYFTREGHALPSAEKILAFFLAKKLLHSENVIEDESASGKVVHEQTELPRGTVDPTMQKLKKEGLLMGGGSNYELPSRRVEEVLDRLVDKQK